MLINFFVLSVIYFSEDLIQHHISGELFSSIAYFIFKCTFKICKVFLESTSGCFSISAEVLQN